MTNNLIDERDIFIMVDLETLGTKIQSPIIQIGAIAFSLDKDDYGRTIPHLEGEFNIKVTPDKESMANTDLPTLRWWLKTDPELLRQLLSKNGPDGEIRDGLEMFTEKAAMCELEKFITDFEHITDKDNIFLIGNGILFDNNFIRHHMDKYDVEYPIIYSNDLDFRTVMKLGAMKMKYDRNIHSLDAYDYKNIIHRFKGHKHDALADSKNQMYMFIKALNHLVYEGDGAI